jgi:hypothetical protein
VGARAKIMEVKKGGKRREKTTKKEWGRWHSKEMWEE